MSPSDPHPLLPLLKRLTSRVDLSEDDRAAVLALPHTIRSLANGAYLVRERERPVNCCLMLSGLSLRHKIVANGGRQILAVHIPGDMVDLQNTFLASSDHNVQMLVPSDVALIPREAIARIAFDHRAVGKAIWIETLVDGSVFREWIANVGRRTARQRIAHLLCEFAVRLEATGAGQERHYELPMSQEQLADSVGLTSVHVNRTLMRLEADGLISRTNRAIIIPDWKALAEAGDFNTHYLHLPAQEAELL